METMEITPKTSHKRTVKDFDISKYMGEWYEIARYENIFERGLLDVSTRYTLLPDKTVKVENKGINRHGKEKKIFGTAFQPEPMNNPAHLRVSFFWWFASDYNIIMLSPDYSYSVVSGNNGKLLWILSRKKVLDGTTLDQIFGFLRTRGYNPSKLVF
ncbi:MAG: lipocalin [Bacteroidales bacterium]|nr:lipocalin [Bacteroidales bacterium]